MKKRIALVLAFVLCLSLGACSQESAQPEQTVTEAQAGQTANNSQAEQAGTLTEDGYYMQEKTTEDGIHLKIYRAGGPEGPIVSGYVTYPDGTYSEERYDTDGKLEYFTWNDTEGSVYEQYYYPSGNVSKSISNYADGSYDEFHYMDNATYDEATGISYDGTITYRKMISADGQVDEETYEFEEDGTRWETDEWPDGTIVKSRYTGRGMLLEQIQDNEATGNHVEITYYENGNEKTHDAYYADHGLNSLIEYYENGSVKYSLMEYDDGTKVEEKINEAGYTTYYRCIGDGINWEFFADDTGELVKYVKDGTVYEGNAIPTDARNTFNQVRKVPAEGTTTSQSEDGSSTTTTTYADGSSQSSSVNADGSYTNQSISADGSEYTEEYYPSGKLKHVVIKSADTYQETYYDEDGYYTYYYQSVPGWTMEITTDETGKVNQVLVNGKAQTDIEKYVKDMFFRSW